MIYDTAIIGAGIFGLTLARAQAALGKSVILFDTGPIGGEAQNASAGLLGALMPASPLVTGPLATVQLRCLSRYATHVEQLESETGLSTGYRRSGRVQPILTEQARDQFARQVAASAERWQDFPAADHLHIVDRVDIDLADAPFGYAGDGVSAQVTPRLLLTALAKSLAGKVTLKPNTRVEQISDNAIITSGATYRAKQIVVTAGWQSGALTIADVKGIKGQACAVAPMLPDAPMIYTPNGYVVFHAAFTALGSTTEKVWSDLAPDTAACEAIKDRAAQLLPALAMHPITECWAGIRPKSTRALPLVTCAADNLIVATGGYKIGLALGFDLAGWLSTAINENAAGDFWNFVAARENFDFSKHP